MFCSFPHRHGEDDARRDRWKHQNEHFVRDFLEFSHFVASKSTFSYDFSLEPENLQPQNRCFVRGFRQFSAHRTKCHACHGICTLSPLDAALPMRFTKNTQHDTSKVLRLPRKMTMDTCHTKRLSTCYRTPLNVTKCHACHAKRSNNTSETSKNDPSCKTSHRHGHTGIARTVADGCERLRTVATVNATSSEHTLNPQTPRVKREPLLRIREKTTDALRMKARPALKRWMIHDPAISSMISL